jgi:hypothetical protein
MRRRKFLGSAPMFFLGTRFVCGRTSDQQTTPKGPDLPEALSAEEATTVNESAMAKDIENFFGKGYS